ncbi:hypothetical protein FBU30_003527 [Linnemannia zychae]|nr:hypothetical protein FBU30_003527 [Linnemannia zychae]
MTISRPPTHDSNLLTILRHTPIMNNNNPWPSGFSNGRFSKHSSRGYHQRKPNPFRTPYRDDEDDGDEDDSGSEGNHNKVGRGKMKNRDLKEMDFVPYRDDPDSQDDDAIRLNSQNERKQDHQLQREPKITNSNGHHDHHESKGESSSGNDSGAFKNPTRIHAKMMDTSPYRVFDDPIPATVTQTISKNAGRSSRPPRNPQGKMRWPDRDSDNEDGEADAEEIIDVNALIAEQERITREMAAQEEALRQEEETTILTKRLAAIRAAEKRGLLRFDGDQLLIPNTENHKADNRNAGNGIAIVTQNRTAQGQDQCQDDIWNSLSHKMLEPHQQRPSIGDRISSSGASSFVGGVDAFNQELKMIDLATSTTRAAADKDRPTFQSSSTNVSASTLIPVLSSTSIPTSANTVPIRKTVSTGVSTSTSTSTSSMPTVAINPRDVLNNITSFLKKVDGVIAGEGESSDDASFSDQEQVSNKSRSNLARAPQENLVNGSEPPNTLDSKLPSVDVTTVTERPATPIPFDLANQENDEDEESYPADPFNTVQTTSDLDLSVRGHIDSNKERITPDSPTAATTMDTENAKSETTPDSPVSSVIPGGFQNHLTGAVATVPERVFSTFSSIFSTGSSFIGLWGGAGSGGEGGMGTDGRRLSDLKYGDSIKYQNHHHNSGANRRTSVGHRHAADDDNSSIDEYDF